MSDSPTELVRLDIAEQIATITLDSDRNRNALSQQLVAELVQHLAAADADNDVRAILITSAGSVFCSGADLTQAATVGMEEGARGLVALQRRIVTSAKPVVVKLNGPVRAGGLGIVGSADIVVASESVTFAVTEVRLGLAPAVISLALLPRLNDRAAADTFLTGRTFTATEAAAIGLITRAVPDAFLDAAIDDVLVNLRKGYPQGLRETKKLLNHDLVARLDALGDQVAAQSAALFATDEAREAMTAFLNRK